MDQLKKLKEINTINEGLFDSIFGKKSDGTTVLKKARGAGYFLNSNYIYRFKSDGSIFPYSQETWQIPKFSWILNTKFEANTIRFENELLYFEGKWLNGDFKGYGFYGSNSSFEGGRFLGQIYNAPNNLFKVQPDQYYSGIYKDDKSGVLGSQYLTKPINNTEQIIELISIPNNWYVILDDGNKKVIFKVVKKLDNVNTDFKFELAPSSNIVTIEWETIRANYLNHGFIAKEKSFSLFGEEFGIQNIKSIIVTPENPGYKVSSKTAINFANDNKLKRFLTYQGEPITFEVDSSSVDGKEFVKNFIQDIVSGTFYKNLELFRKYIETGEIKGYSDAEFINLAPIFNNERNGIVSNRDVHQLMKYFDDVMKYIVEDSKYVKKLLIKSLKKHLGLDKLSTKEEKPEPKPDFSKFAPK